MGEPQPLLLRPGTEEFPMPATSNGWVRFEHQEQLELFCSNGFRRPFSGNSISAECLNGTRFLVGTDDFTFEDFMCADLPIHTARHTNRTCFNGNTIAEIGMEVDNRWVHLMDVCHDAVQAVNLWVHFEQKPGNLGFQRGFPRIQFIQGNFYRGMDVNAMYTTGRQRRTIADLLNSTALSWDIIQNDNDIFLARGHMAARTDYVYGVQQQASFYYINAAPQFQSFNGGNWESVETSVRQFVFNRNIEVEIWTGTYGVVTFADSRGIQTEIYLDGPNRRIPVPKIFYKVVIHEPTARGIVLIGVNNPHLTIEEINSSYMFCENVAHLVNYISWEKDNIYLGYSYACEVNEFAKYVGHLPQLPVVRRLLL